MTITERYVGTDDSVPNPARVQFYAGDVMVAHFSRFSGPSGYDPPRPKRRESE